MGNVEKSALSTDTPWPHAATLVLAAETPRQRNWAVATAIEIIRKLAAERPKVVLADLQTRKPSALAAALGVEEGPGIVDVLFRGASFSASAHRPDREAFFYLSIGTKPPPGQVLYQHPRWKKIAARLSETDAHLLPCVSAGDWLDAGPIPGFEASIVLNAAGLEIELPAGARRLAEFLAPPEIRNAGDSEVELPAYASPPPEPEIEAPLGPEARVEPEAQSELDTQPMLSRPPSPDPQPELAPEPEPAAQTDDVEAITPPPVRAAGPLTTPVPESREEPAESPAFAPPPAEAPFRRSPSRSGFRLGRRGIVSGVAVAAAAVLVVALWKTVGGRQIPEESMPLEAAAAETESVREAETATPPPPPEPRRQEVPLPYSVAIASFSSFDDAVARQREWTRADIPFYVAPTVVRGVVYYRVFAGMLAERTEAEQLMAQLVQDGVKDTERDWDVRPAGLAFKFGTYPTTRDAREVLETLLGRGVPAYIVPAHGTAEADGFAYHVYAGGYENAGDARPLQEHIERVGLDVELVERVGLVQQ